MKISNADKFQNSSFLFSLHIYAEEEKNKVCNIEEFQVVSENLHDRTIEDNVVEVKSKENKDVEFNSEENRSDGNEHEKQASNQKGQLKCKSL